MKRGRLMLMIDAVRSLVLGSSWLGLVALAGCGEYRVPVGSEGAAVNAGQCLGEPTKCSPPLEGDWLDTLDPQACDGALAGTFTSTFSTESVPYSAEQVEAAADGSAWVMGTESVYGPGIEDHVRAWARHYDPSGVLIGQNDNVAEAGRHTVLQTSITPGPEGGAVVYVYSLFAATADDDPIESSSLVHLDADANLSAPAVKLTGMSSGHVAVGSGGSITVAASASGNASRGRLVRVAPGGEPVFVQPNVPSNSQSIGGVAGLALHGQGASTILSNRSRTFENQTSTVGIAKYDASGAMTHNWLVPTNFKAGYPVTLASTPEGHIVVGGETDSPGVVVLVYSSEGEALFAWQLAGNGIGAISADEATGAILVHAGGLAVLSPDGAACRRYSGSNLEQTPAAGTLTFSDGWTLTRPGLAVE